VTRNASAMTDPLIVKPTATDPLTGRVGITWLGIVVIVGAVGQAPGVGPGPGGSAPAQTVASTTSLIKVTAALARARPNRWAPLFTEMLA